MIGRREQVDVRRRAELVRHHERDRDRDQHRHERDAALFAALALRPRTYLPEERALFVQEVEDGADDSHWTKLRGSCITIRAWLVSLYSLSFASLMTIVMRTRLGKMPFCPSDCVVSHVSCQSKFFQFQNSNLASWMSWTITSNSDGRSSGGSFDGRRCSRRTQSI